MLHYNNLSQIKTGAALSYLSMGLGYIISIIYTPIMLRLLGQSEYGLYNLVASIVAYLGVLNFGFVSAYMRYYSRFKLQEENEKIASLNGMFLVIFSVLGLITLMAGTVLAANTELIFGSELTSLELRKARILIIILVINLAISFPNTVFVSHITANEKFIFQKIIEVIRVVVNPFVVLPVLILGYGSIGMVIATSVLNIVIEVINADYCIRRLRMRFSFEKFNFILMSEMIMFSSFVFINLIVDQINWNVDKFILGRFHGTISVAIYGLASQLNTYYLVISTTISSVFVPRVHKIVASTNDNYILTKLFTRIGRIQFVFLSIASSGLIFFGKPFINMWAGQDYIDAYPIALVLTITGTISLIQNIGIEIQRAKNMHQFRSWIYLVIALLNIAISIPLAKNYGGFGAAIGTGIAIVIGNGVIMNWYYHTKVGIDINYFWRQILEFVPSLILPCIMGILFNFFYDLNILSNFVIFGFFYVLVFGISFWILGLNRCEKDLIEKPIRVILMKIVNRN